MLGAAGFITPVLVTYFGSTAGAVIVGLLIGIFGALPISSEFFRLLCGGSSVLLTMSATIDV